MAIIKLGVIFGLSIGLLLIAFGFAGCSSEPAHVGTEGADSGRNHVDGVQKLFDTMPLPDLALIISGQLDGYLEPCGCSQGKAGGLARRYEFVEGVRSRGWPVALVDLGGFMGEEAAARNGIEQSVIKFRYTLKAMELLKYDVVALNPQDLQIGVEQAMKVYGDGLPHRTGLVAANVTATGGAPIIKSRVVAAGKDAKLGVTAVIDPALLNGVEDRGKHGFLSAIEPPGDALPSILSELESVSDYQVLLVNGSYELARKLAVANPRFDVVVVTTDSIGAINRRAEIVNGGKTRLVSVGRRGYAVGVFAFYRDQPPIFQLVALGDSYDGPARAMKSIIQGEYRAALKAAAVVEKFPRGPAIGPSGNQYVGAGACRMCHTNTFDKWSTTKHAQAFSSLLNDPKPDTAFDVECVSCHTTGFKHASGWRSEAATPNLAGNQCENCHGPGSRHAAEPDHLEYRRSMVVAGESARAALCLKCHDHDNSPEFDLARYWSQIAHTGLDDRSDPRRHRGVAQEGKTPR